MATTTIAVHRLAPGTDIDPYVVSDDDTAYVMASGVRAHISTPTGRERVLGAGQETVEFQLMCDPTDIENNDQVVDEVEGTTYEVIWAEARRGLGVDHTVGGLKKVTGQA